MKNILLSYHLSFFHSTLHLLLEPRKLFEMKSLWYLRLLVKKMTITLNTKYNLWRPVKHDLSWHPWEYIGLRFIQDVPLKEFEPRGVLPTMTFTREASPGRGTLIRIQAYERIGISQVQVYERAGNSVFRVISNILKRYTLTWPYRFNLLNGSHKEKKTNC